MTNHRTQRHRPADNATPVQRTARVAAAHDRRDAVIDPPDIAADVAAIRVQAHRSAARRGPAA